MEEWKDIPGYEGQYMVSDKGRVLSVARTVVCKRRGNKTHAQPVPGRLLRPGIASHGYPTVSLGRHNTKTVHSLVAETFLGPAPEGHEILHFDGCRANLALSNLRYGTRKENIEDARRHGTYRGF